VWKSTIINYPRLRGEYVAKDDDGNWYCQKCVENLEKTGKAIVVN